MALPSIVVLCSACSGFIAGKPAPTDLAQALSVGAGLPAMRPQRLPFNQKATSAADTTSRTRHCQPQPECPSTEPFFVLGFAPENFPPGQQDAEK
ncbi:hypothetical protein DVB73_10040 [Pseudomonas plecoglossicida]|uniref:Uncharacterized protein n=1 Tax=Pseudomonas plecoglossicida TaxID=70775 RepID=A0AAD0QXK8_PSEDL|nr:hypothetical protein DVB73_10040 [Pseudomonas plecoglossicida]